MTNDQQKSIYSEFGTDVLKAIEDQTRIFGSDFVNIERVLNTTREIISLGTNTLASVYESLFYEPFYYDNFEDLKNCIKKGGFEVNRKNVERMINVGIELPEEITILL